MFNKEKFNEFYQNAEVEIRRAVEKYKISATILFGMGHRRVTKEIKL